jgi:hypothetical protein
MASIIIPFFGIFISPEVNHVLQVKLAVGNTEVLGWRGFFPSTVMLYFN